MSNQIFQTLKELPTPLDESQCVIHKHELLICGGYKQRACYSYHTLKNEYKLICEYPSHVKLYGHCVVKLVNNNNKDRNQITLLSFGGAFEHTLVMKYASVWSNISNKSNEFNNYNKWTKFTNNDNNPIIIGHHCDYRGARAVIGGSNNHLLFITYYKNNISVFDLNTFQSIKHSRLSTNFIRDHCFVSNPENGKWQEMVKTNKQNQMMLFCNCTGLSIEYDEDNTTFQFHELPVCDDIASLNRYAYVCINNAILFFGGWSFDGVSKSVHKYLIRENKWMTFENNLPSPLENCVAVLNEEDNDIHIIGGRDDKNTILSTHMKAKLRIWDVSQLSKNEITSIIEYWIRILKIKLGWIDDFDKIIMKYIFSKILNQYTSVEDKEGVHDCLQKQSWINSNSIIMSEIDIILIRWNKIIKTNFIQNVKQQRVVFYENKNEQEIVNCIEYFPEDPPIQISYSTITIFQS
ncbi:hypothetical protein RFI_00479 [Reticulomyxa filosa]|uniref:Kelch motif family protein n=1 Tax=Reticulomyxa filosa TaxID=46433 RepID=X6PEP9_RETFI|nr:hypothetical protein RFI_00479 [Reticulomyxa filosa]|eukprot:ETO36583.1 hypothetical protein RFI_00479 [Reticulomyxa filosa]